MPSPCTRAAALLSAPLVLFLMGACRASAPPTPTPVAAAPDGSAPVAPGDAAPAASPSGALSDTLARAAGAANDALDRAYASQPERMAQHVGPWVTPDWATWTRDAAGGAIVRWTRFAPAGFAYEAEVVVDAKGGVRVTRATASYSPD
jgi:hypothetical protein